MGACVATEHALCRGNTVKVEDTDLLLGQIRDASGLDEFAVIGSLSALGLVGEGLPPRMTRSMEVDAYA